MRTPSALLATALLAAPGTAQLIAVHFKDPKLARRHEEHLTVFQGELVVVGEAWSNLAVDPAAARIAYVDPKNHYVELVTADPADPTKLPYKLDGDDRKLTVSKRKVGISTDDVAKYSFYMADGSLPGLAADYADRRERVDELRAERDGHPKGGPPWMAAHQRMLQQMERLHGWLASSLFPQAAAKYEKELLKERKVVASEAAAARLAAAKASIRLGQPHPDLLRIAGEAGAGEAAYAVQESLHCRIVYRAGIDDLRVHELLVLAEEIIDGFRIEFIDPHLDAAYEDHVPERTFAEWFFDYDDIPRHERMLTAYYRYPWDPEKKEESLKLEGHRMQRAAEPEYVHPWRTGDQADLEGRVAHDLGHDLANQHYDRRRLNMSQDWLGEGCAIFVSLEWLGRNSVNCKGWAQPGKYVHQRKTEGTKTPQIGLRDWYNALALESGAPIEKLALKTLYEMGDGDLAKSWSFFDWQAKKGGKDGQLFLRAACEAARKGKTFVADWRAKAEEIYDVEGTDVFDLVDGRWKEFAALGQDTGDASRK
jgi:hypothetical protein